MWKPVDDAKDVRAQVNNAHSQQHQAANQTTLTTWFSTIHAVKTTMYWIPNKSFSRSGYRLNTLTVTKIPTWSDRRSRAMILGGVARGYSSRGLGTNIGKMQVQCLLKNVEKEC